MSEQNPYGSGPDNHDTRPDHAQEQVHRYGPPPGSPPAPAQTPEAPGRRGRGFVAGMLAAALVVGGLAGLGGAAAFVASDQSGGSGTSTTTMTSPVVQAGTSGGTSGGTAPAGSVEKVAASVLPSVVKINVTGQQGSGSGSGIVISSDGEILTNNHVVAVAGDGGSITVNFNDGSSARAKVTGTDPVTDLAVIKAQNVSGLTPATVDTSSSIDVGEQVVAIGSPFGLEATVTSGIVSAVNRPVSVGTQTGSGSDTTYPAIQTDAAINPGNSGGPLVNYAGAVIGINSSIRTASSSMTSEGGSIGLGFAIPISKVWPIVQQLRGGETPTHARLGVTVRDVTDTANGLLSGAEIGEVTAGSAADDAGLQQGDVVTKVGDNLISGSESLVATIRGERPGDKVTLTYVRGGQTRTADITLDSDKGSPTS